MSRARAAIAAFRRETGASAVEYCGVLLIAGLIFAGLFQLDIPGNVARWAGTVVGVVNGEEAANEATAGNGQSTGGSGQNTGGSGQNTGGSGQSTGGSGQSTGGSGQSTGGSGQSTGVSGQNTGGSGQNTGGSGQNTGGSGQSTAGNGQSTGGNGQSTGGNGQSTGGNGQSTGGNGQSTGGNGQSTSGNGQGTSGNGQGTNGNGQSTGGDGGSSIPCTEAADAGLCMAALAAPNGIEEKVQERARNAVKKAANNLANSDNVKPGSPEHEKLVNKLNKAVDDLRESRKITEHPFIKATSPIRKYANPRYKDLQQHANRLSKVLPGLANKKPPTAPISPPSGTTTSTATKAANKVLGGLGKFGKGLGIVGTAISGYDNIRKDGWAKGATETLGGAAIGYGATSAVLAGCGMVAVATAGVGGLVCAGGALIVGAVASKYGKQATAWAYDHAGEAWNFTKDTVSDGAKAAAHTAVEGGKKIVGGAGKVISSLKPGFL